MLKSTPLKYFTNQEESKIDFKLPDSARYFWDQISTKNASIILEQYSDWRLCFSNLCEINKWELIQKRSSKSDESKENLNQTYICHHGFRPNYPQYSITPSEHMNSMRKKKNHCQFELKIKISSKSPKIFHIWQLNDHNHSLDLVARSFAKIKSKTVEKIHELFNEDKTPSEARKQIEKNLTPIETVDRSEFPRNNDYYSLYYKWQKQLYGDENGPQMFAKIGEFLSKYDGKFFYSRIFVQNK